MEKMDQARAVSVVRFSLTRLSTSTFAGMDCLKGVLLPGGRANEFAVPLLVLIAQQRSHIIYREEQSHLKLIGGEISLNKDIYIYSGRGGKSASLYNLLLDCISYRSV